jgi:hypothetical protein
MVEETFKKRIEIVAQTLAVAVLATYVSGFIVLTVYHSNLGISQLNLLRPKILAAGVLVGILFGIPVVETLRLPKVKAFLVIPPYTREKWSAGLAMLPSLVVVMVLTGGLLRQMFVGSWFSPGTHILWVLWGTAPLLVASAAVDTWPVPKFVRWSVFILALVWLVYCLYRTRDRILWAVVAWFLWCAFAGLRMYGPLTNTEKLRTVDLAQIVFGVVTTFGVFGLWLYDCLPAMLMGGEPVPATISFKVQDKSPLEGNQRAKVWIIDETAEGFYFLPTKDAKKAVFIPRETVGAIYYGD